LGKVDWLNSSIPNHKFKSVFKSIMALLGSSVSWTKDWYVLAKITDCHQSP